MNSSVLKSTENSKNSSPFSSSFSAVFYVAEGSDDYVNFIGEDREFVCDGSNGRWMLHNNTEIFESSAKYTLVKDENESKLVIKNINLKDSGDYRCLSSKAEKVFNLKLYCELHGSFTSIFHWIHFSPSNYHAKRQN
jgi:hypothetical protein